MLAGKGLEEGLAQARAEIFSALPSSKDLLPTSSKVERE